MIEQDLLHGARRDRVWWAAQPVVAPVKLARVVHVGGVHRLRTLLHCSAVPIARPWCAIERRAYMNRLNVEEKMT